MSAIHLICHRDASGNLESVSHIAGTQYQSACWDLSDEEVLRLLGGWIYFHQAKRQRSEFGGRILSFYHGKRDSAAKPIGIVFTLEAHLKGHGQKWRGQDHGRAWTGGIVEASLEHEIEAANA